MVIKEGFTIGFLTGAFVVHVMWKVIMTYCWRKYGPGNKKDKANMI